MRSINVENAEDIRELIERRRRQVLVHSVIYYKFNANVVTDAVWASWALELEELQARYPEIAEDAWYAEYFEDFDHSTGYSLPLDDPWAVRKAELIMKCHEKFKEKVV